jgi:hypothetical protein
MSKKNKSDNNNNSDKIKIFRYEMEKLKEELFNHEKNMENLKNDIAELKKIIKLGNTGREKDSL